MPNSSDPTDQPEKRKPLSADTAIKSAEPGEHMVTGAIGLILRVHAAKDGSRTRSWIVRVSVNGQRRRLGLGQYPTVALAAARQKAADAHRALADGIDPSVSAKRLERASEAARNVTLGKAIDEYLVIAPPYKNHKSAEIRERALRGHFGSLHHRDVGAISAIDIAAILRTLSPQTAIKSHTAIRKVLDFAATALEPHGVVIVNPADPRRLRSVGWAPQPSGESTEHPALHWSAVPELVVELTKLEDVVAKCALLIVATAVRCKTARLAKWANIDFVRREWTPPLADLKDGKHHKRSFIVPLNAVALAALEAMRDRSSSRFVFANSAGGPIMDGDITNLIRRLRRRHPDWLDPDSKLPFTFHGARASFRTWAEEMRPLDDKLAELSLGHKVHGEVAIRYIRTGLVEERRALLDAWGRHLTMGLSTDKNADVIVFPLRTTN